MRRLLALGCCAAYLAFGFVAGTAHVHEAADHHDTMRGLHLDHDHLGGTPDHGQDGHHHPHAPSDAGGAGLEVGHVAHHEGDALYLTVTAQRSFDAGPRVAPAIVAVGATIETSPGFAVRRHELPDSLRGPPKLGPAPPRAPPV